MPGLDDISERDDAGPGAGERDGGLRSVLLFDGAADARQGGLCGRGGVSAGAAGGHAAQRADLISFSALLGELAVGLVYGLTLALLNEMLLFAGQIVGLQFSFSLVNLMDPASAIQTPLLGELFQLMGTLVVITAGLDRILLASMVRSFRAAPLGSLRASAPAALDDCARRRRHLSGRGGAGRAGAGGHHAGRGGGGAAGQAQPAVAGDVADRAPEDADRLCASDGLAGALAALHRGAIRRAARSGRAADSRPARAALGMGG